MKKDSNSRTKNSILNLMTGIGGHLLVIILKFVTRTVFIYTLGKAYLGINGLFADILSMLSLTELGFDTAINYKLYKPLAEGDDKRVRVLLKFYKQAYRCVGAAIMIIGLSLIPLLPHLIRDYERLETLKINAVLIFILFLLQSVSSYLFFAYKSTIMKANQKRYVLDIADYVVTIVTNVVQILVLVFLRNFIIYTATVIVFNIIKNFINATISQKYYPQFFIKEKDSLSKEEVKGLFKDCGALFVYKVNSVVLKATDNLVLSTFIGLIIVGMYSNYLLFYNTLRVLLNKLYVAVRASAGNLFATADVSVKYQFFEIMNYITVILYGTVGAWIAVCSDELITVWAGADYVIAQPFAILIGIEMLFYGLMCNLGQIRNISGVFRQMWYRPILGCIVNLVVSVVLVQVCGIYGVIIGTISSVVFTNFMVDPVVIHKYSFNNYRPVSVYYIRNLKYIALLVAVVAFDLFVCSRVFLHHSWGSVIVHSLFTVMTVPVVFILVYYRSHECQYLLKMVKRIRASVMKKLRGNHSKR